MANIYQVQARFRAALLLQERAAAAEMVRHYGAAYQRIQAQVYALMERAAQAKAVGEYSPSWVYQQRRLELLRLQILGELQQFAATAGVRITDQQRRAVEQAQTDSAALTQAVLGNKPDQGNPAQSGNHPAGIAVTFARLPSDAVQDLIGTLQDGSPLKTLIDSIAPNVSENVMAALVSGLALGDGPREIARRVRQAAGVGLTRALTISRTETLRSYRTASIRSYQANDDVVKAWRWTASLSARTCAVCLAMDGQEFPLDTPFASHPNCRCSPVPVTKTYAEMGLDVPEAQAPERQDGAAWFADQPADVQREVLGDAKYQAYRSGRIDLSDLVAYRDDPRWGPVRSEKSLTQALA